MREGRDKGSAAGAAAVAAAMLEARKAPDGIAMVPNHPLPVVFPKPDGLPPSLRFLQKFGAGGIRSHRSRQRARAEGDDTEEDNAALQREVVEDEEQFRRKGIHRELVMRVQVLDERRRPIAIKNVPHFNYMTDYLPLHVIQHLVAHDLKTPTLLQIAALPKVLEGKDLFGVAPIGSGKLVTTGIVTQMKLQEIFHSNDPRPADNKGVAYPLVLVVCPSRERVLRAYATIAGICPTTVKISYTYSTEEAGAHTFPTDWTLCDVFIGTPDHLSKLQEDGALRMDGVHLLVVDGAKTIQDDGKLPTLQQVMSSVRHNHLSCQTVMWSNTTSRAVEELAAQELAPLAVSVVVTATQRTASNIRHILYPAKSYDDALLGVHKLYNQHVISKLEQVLVFCSSQDHAERLASHLTEELSAPPSLVRWVHSGLRHAQRVKLLEAFKERRIRILIATDVVTPDVVFPDLEHVINFELPYTDEQYMRRFSFVGASGREGMVHTFLVEGDPRTPDIIQFVENQIGRPLGEEIRSLMKGATTHGTPQSWHGHVEKVYDDHTAMNSKWRVRGRQERGIRQAMGVPHTDTSKNLLKTSTE
ncbi:ATP-dependent RNA helicase DDX5/DBP2 [Angomonas deanei]|nr:ATP-dependent RNA helicase DDX5/DBP2 [Angomonas deanei]|eukprot:EPY31573.1 ATP-dependent RNA helicase DDX5/DBP2 [Angomonas deanei]